MYVKKYHRLTVAVFALAAFVQGFTIETTCVTGSKEGIALAVRNYQIALGRDADIAFAADNLGLLMAETDGGTTDNGWVGGG